ncbi:MARVEL domain-containing 1 [Paramuricea clavata]|uniref:MARVEL domain-containing 1 n=1 Tax=Paramuricea clavata TaxID=317549 RepID=A0A6S7JA35_PARCT|nr:MARVEL domain-containing 1 [Paramuricea clavata]
MEIGKGLYYITSTPGILKIFEFVALLISLSCIGGFINTLNNSRGTWNFFMFSVAATWILTMISFLFFTLGAHQKFPSINWILAMAIIYFIFTVMLLIASGILANNARSYKISGLCDSWESVSGDIECNNLVVAVIFAFVAFVLYSLDTLFHFWLSIVIEPDASEDETAEMEPKEQQSPNGV